MPFRSLVLVLLCWVTQVASASAWVGEPIRLLVYGDSNTWGWVPNVGAFPTTRYPAATRYPEVMRQRLGDGYEVVVDGLSARTINVDHVTALGVLSAQHFNGLRDIDTAIARELPLTVVLIMLGSNDVAADQQRRVEEIGEGAAQLIRRVRGIGGGVATHYPAPQVLLIAPPPLGRMDRTPMGERFDSISVEKSRQLAGVMREVARREGVHFFDAGQVLATIEGIDGIHLTAAQQIALGDALATEVRRLFPVSIQESNL